MHVPGDPGPKQTQDKIVSSFLAGAAAAATATAVSW